MKLKPNKRVVIFGILTVFLCVCSLFYGIELHGVLFPESSFADEVGELIIDGSDLSGILKLGAAVTQGFIQFVVTVAYILLVTIGTAIAYAIMRFASIRPTSAVEEGEIKLTKIILWSAAGLFFLIAQIATGFRMFFQTLGLFWQIPLFGSLFQILGLRKRQKNQLTPDIPINFLG